MGEDHVERLDGAFARSRVDDAAVLKRQDLALVIFEGIMDHRVVELDTAAAVHGVSEELPVGAVVGAGASVGVDVEQRPAKARGGRERTRATDLRQELGVVPTVEGDEGIEVDMEQRLVHIEDDGLEHVTSFH